MNKIWETLTDPQYANIIKTIVTLTLGYLLRSLTIRIVHKRVEDTKLYYKIRRIITYTYFTIIAIILMVIWTSAGVGGLSTYLGLASAGLAIALKDLLINIAAWMFIMIKKPYIVGDRIEINGQSGDVIDQRLFQFTIMEIGKWVSNDQSTGRMVHLPNSVVFNHPLANYTSGFRYIWSEVDVLLTFESDYRKAKNLFLQVAENHSLKQTDALEKEMKNASKKYMIYYSNLTPIVYTDVKDSGVMLSIRYLCRPHDRRTTVEKIWEDILQIIQEHEDIDLAYNTVRMVNISK